MTLLVAVKRIIMTVLMTIRGEAEQDVWPLASAGHRAGTLGGITRSDY